MAGSAESPDAPAGRGGARPAGGPSRAGTVVCGRRGSSGRAARGGGRWHAARPRRRGGAKVRSECEASPRDPGPWGAAPRRRGFRGGVSRGSLRKVGVAPGRVVAVEGEAGEGAVERVRGAVVGVGGTGGAEAVLEGEAVVAEVAYLVFELVEGLVRVEVLDVLEAELVEGEDLVPRVVLELRESRVEVDEVSLGEAVVGAGEGGTVDVEGDVVSVVGLDAVSFEEVDRLAEADGHGAAAGGVVGGGGLEDAAIEVADGARAVPGDVEANGAESGALGGRAGQGVAVVEVGGGAEAALAGFDGKGVPARTPEAELRAVEELGRLGGLEAGPEALDQGGGPGQDELAANFLPGSAVAARLEAVSRRQVDLLEADVRPGQRPEELRADSAAGLVRQGEHRRRARIAPESEDREPELFQALDRTSPIQVHVLQLDKRLVDHRDRRQLRPRHDRAHQDTDADADAD
eukprot:CAMPEP_0197398418 /NCGR_PEP_ID=MMETSP1165-20131217/13350_1 /TAXON_ID=284809 /ORGANISM="Chrysocystis fragilis, Strain CCMP3189" /LENGTH=461 /DNA_ID=CAMNT_0042924371 /DNA_START=45 /DNA_END=1428 /DNA_ORIENTATION=+